MKYTITRGVCGVTLSYIYVVFILAQCRRAYCEKQTLRILLLPNRENTF